MLPSFKSRTALPLRLLLLILLSAVFYINWPFIIPLTLAGIFSLGMHDLIDRFSQKTKLNSKLITLIILFLGFALFWTPLALAVYRIVTHISQPQTLETDQILKQVHALKDLVLQGLSQLSDLTGADLANPAKDLFEKSIQKIGTLLLNFSTQFLTQLPSLFLSGFIFAIVLFLLLIKSKEMKSGALKYSPLPLETTETLIQVLKRSCSLTLFSTLTVGMVQALLIGLGSLIFGEGDFWLVLTITFLVSFIPVIGAAPMGFLLALLAFLGDRIGPAIGMAVVATIAGSLDNFLKPLLMSGSSKVSPIVGFTCVLGAVIMMGLPGLLLGPIIINIFTEMVPVLIKKDENL